MSKSNVPEILRNDAGTYERKAADYAPGTDPYENFQFSAEFAHRLCEGLPTDDRRRATATLIGVKISRLQTLGLARAANNEGILDTIGDLRVYLGILEDQHRAAIEREAGAAVDGLAREEEVRLGLGGSSVRADLTPDTWRHHKPLSEETREEMMKRFARAPVRATSPQLDAGTVG